MSGVRRVVIPGGAGSVGRALARYLAADYEVVVLSRDANVRVEGARVLPWDGQTLDSWQTAIDGAAAVVNLAGRSVNCRYNERNKTEIMTSRIASTRVLAAAIARCSTPPPVWLNASTATIYRHTFARDQDDISGEIGAHPDAYDAFSIEVATAWEREFFEAAVPTRKVALRAAMVLGHAPNSVLPTLLRLVRFGLGGKAGDGKQYMSWIHERDFCRAVRFLMEHALGGPVNLAAPTPVPNATFMRELRRAARMPFGLPAARWQLNLGTWLLRTEAELIVKSRRVVPRKLTDAGFRFEYPELSGALKNLLAHA